MTRRTHHMLLLSLATVMATCHLAAADEPAVGSAGRNDRVIVERIVRNWSDQAAQVKSVRAEVLEWERGKPHKVFLGGRALRIGGRGLLIAGELVIEADGNANQDFALQFSVRSGTILFDQARWRIDLEGDFGSLGTPSLLIDNGRERIEHWKGGNGQPDLARRSGSSAVAYGIPQLEIWDLLYRQERCNILQPRATPPETPMPDLPFPGGDGVEVVILTSPSPLTPVAPATLVDRIQIVGIHQQVNDQDCIQLQTDPQTSSSAVRLWVAPALDDRIVMLEERLPTGGLRRTTIEYRKNAEFGWVPDRWRTVESLAAGTPQPEAPNPDSAREQDLVHYSLDTKVLRLDLNPEIDEATWEYTIPEGTNLIINNADGMNFW